MAVAKIFPECDLELAADLLNPRNASRQSRPVEKTARFATDLALGDMDVGFALGAIGMELISQRWSTISNSGLLACRAIRRSSVAKPVPRRKMRRSGQFATTS